MLKTNKDHLTLSVKSKTWTRDFQLLFHFLPCCIWTWGSSWVIPRKDQPFADVPGLKMILFHVWASYIVAKTLKWIQTPSATLPTNHWSIFTCYSDVIVGNQRASLDNLELHSISGKVILFSPNFTLVRLLACVADANYRRLLGYLRVNFLLQRRLCVSQSLRYSSKCFAQIYGSQHGAAILECLHGSPIQLKRCNRYKCSTSYAWWG